MNQTLSAIWVHPLLLAGLTLACLRMKTATSSSAAGGSCAVSIVQPTELSRFQSGPVLECETHCSKLFNLDICTLCAECGMFAYRDACTINVDSTASRQCCPSIRASRAACLRLLHVIITIQRSAEHGQARL